MKHQLRQLNYAIIIVVVFSMNKYMSLIATLMYIAYVLLYY